MEGIYKICFYGGLTLAIILLITSVVLFIVFKIPKVIGDLTGRNARREIAVKQSKKGRSENTASRLSRQEQKKYYNQGTGKITIRDSATNDDATVKIAGDVETPEVMPEERETDILRPEDEIGIQINKTGNSGSEDETTVLGENKKNDSEAETTILGGSSEDETAVLQSEDEENSSENKDIFEPDGETDVLKNEDDDFDPDAQTDILREDTKETDDESTTVLTGNKSNEDKTAYKADNIEDDDRYIYSVIVVHTDEKL